MQEITLELLKQILERELPKDKTKELNFYLDLSKWTYKGVHLKDIRVIKAPYEIRFELRVAYKDKITTIQVYDSKDCVYKLGEFATKEISNNKNILSNILYDILGTQYKNNIILSIYKDYLTLSNKLIKITQVYYSLNSIKKAINVTLLYEYNDNKYYMELYDIFKIEYDIDKEVERLGV